MKLDYSPRGAGKTTRLIEWLRDDKERLMLTFSHDEENRLKREYPDVATQIVDWDSYQHSKGVVGRRYKECAIDNAELILQQRMRHPISMMSITEDLSDKE
jgi:hypothetical protein